MSLAFPVLPPRRSRLMLAAALVLGGTAGSAIAQDAASATSATTLSARRIVIDSVTGRPRVPDHEDFAAMKQERDAAAAQRSAAATARGAAAEPAFSAHPVLQRMQGQAVATKFGATGRRVGAEKLSFSVVQRNAEGRIETQCVVGEDAAAHAQHTHATEGGHAQ